MGEVRFVIQNLEKFLILTEITIFPFFKKLDFLRVSQEVPCKLAHSFSGGSW